LQFLPGCNLLSKQSDINENMRKVLIGWIVEVHYKFKLLPETLHIIVNLIDRYTELVDFPRGDY